MTIEKDYAKDEDQQVPDTLVRSVKKDSIPTQLRKPSQGLPDFDALLTDLVGSGTLDPPVKEENSSLEATQDAMDMVYSDRSFYDDYSMMQLKKEPIFDSKMDACGVKGTQMTGEALYGSDLGLLTDEASYGYAMTHSQPTGLEGSSMSEGFGMAAPEEPFGEPAAENEVIQKIERASLELGISKDPYQWEPDQSHRWAEWTLKLYNLPVSYVMDFYMNGTIMCMLSQDEFRRRCPEFGDYLYAELDLWKSAYSFISSPLHSSSSSSSGHSDDEELKYQAMDDLSSSAPSFTSLTPSQSTLTSTQLSAIPTPVIMPNTRAGQSYTLSDSFSHHQREPTLLQAAQGHTRLLSGGGCISRSVQPCVSPAPSLGSSGDASWSSSPSLLHEDRSEDIAMPADSSCDLPHIGRGKHAIHLWQFLKELLLQPHAYHSCIRWLDRSKGIFKIEDSTRVAKLWGQRKNRPAMNYDKLSRSIRQYYKKGIIKKTENSKRLVYQFQPQYR